MRFMIFGEEVEVPDWAKWVAQDEDGEWYWYATRPEPSKQQGVWYCPDPEYWCINDAGPAFVGNPNKKWMDEVYEVVDQRSR